MIEPPPRFLLRPAGLLTQVCSAGALLLGTIAFVLVQQNRSGGAALVIAWAAAAMAGLVFGGLMPRGALVAVVAGAALDALFGVVLLAMDADTLRGLLRILPASDVEMIATILVIAAVVMLATSALSLASIPQARTYGKALREAEAEYAADEAAVAQSFAAMRTQPPIAPPQLAAQASARSPGYPPPGEQLPAYGYGAAPRTQPEPAATSAPPTQPEQPQPRASFPSGRLPLPPPAQTGPRALYQSRPSAGALVTPLTAGPPVPPPSTAPNTWGNEPSIEVLPAAAPTAQTNPWGTELQSPAATAPGWVPNKARTTMMIIRPPADERRSRRRLYIALAGLAIGVGIGVGAVLGAQGGASEVAAGSNGRGSATTSAGSGAANSGMGAANSGGTKIGAHADGANAGSAGANAGGGSAQLAGSSAAAGSAVPLPVAAPDVPVRALLTQQRDLIGKVDATGLAALVATNAFAIGLDAAHVAEGRAAVEEVLRADLGEAPPDGFTVTSKFLAVGQEGTHAWTAEELELAGPGVETRRIAITQLCAFVGGRWTVLALQWAHPVSDATAERLAILGTLPTPTAIPSKVDGSPELDTFVRSAFASRASFAAARSERPDGFNFGSAPGERVVGGSAIKRLFGRLRSELRLRDGVRVVAGGVWDPTQKAAPWIGYAALNVDYTQKSRAATDLTQTFRVLAVLLREGESWTIVQTQFSHAKVSP